MFPILPSISVSFSLLFFYLTNVELLIEFVTKIEKKSGGGYACGGRGGRGEGNDNLLLLSFSFWVRLFSQYPLMANFFTSFYCFILLVRFGGRLVMFGFDGFGSLVLIFKCFSPCLLVWLYGPCCVIIDFPIWLMLCRFVFTDKNKANWPQWISVQFRDQSVSYIRWNIAWIERCDWFVVAAAAAVVCWWWWWWRWWCFWWKHLIELINSGRKRRREQRRRKRRRGRRRQRRRQKRQKRRMSYGGCISGDCAGALYGSGVHLLYVYWHLYVSRRRSETQHSAVSPLFPAFNQIASSIDVVLTRSSHWTFIRISSFSWLLSSFFFCFFFLFFICLTARSGLVQIRRDFWNAGTENLENLENRLYLINWFDWIRLK